jgi:hypothetical protein
MMRARRGKGPVAPMARARNPVGPLRLDPFAPPSARPMG